MGVARIVKVRMPRSTAPKRAASSPRLQITGKQYGGDQQRK